MKTIKVVGALINSSDKFLVAQRAKGELVGSWEFPGGKIEEGETEFEAIKREINEELGVTVTAREKISDFEYKYPFATIKLSLIKCFLNNNSQSIVLDGSHSEIRWITSEVSDIEFAPLDQIIFNFIKSGYKNRESWMSDSRG